MDIGGRKFLFKKRRAKHALHKDLHDFSGKSGRRIFGLLEGPKGGSSQARAGRKEFGSTEGLSYEQEFCGGA